MACQALKRVLLLVLLSKEAAAGTPGQQAYGSSVKQKREPQQRLRRGPEAAIAGCSKLQDTGCSTSSRPC